MKKYQFIVCVKLSLFFVVQFSMSNALGETLSTMKTTVSGVKISNMHKVFQGTPSSAQMGEIYRGVAPKKQSDFADLKKLGISHVVVFKNFQKSAELESERESLIKIGIKDENILHIPMVWKDLPSFKEGCEQTLDAIEFIKKNSSDPKQKLYFHCTVGEDRTGLLAGVLRQLLDKWQMDKSYKEEMCARGYGDGNPNKPSHVANSVHDALTPLFWKLSFKIEKGYLSWDNLDRRQCEIDPEVSDNYKNFIQTKPLKKTCKN